MNNKTDTAQSLIGSLIALISGFTLNEWAALFGILFGAASVWIAYRKYKEDVAIRKEEMQAYKQDMAYQLLAAKIEAKKLGIDLNE